MPLRLFNTLSGREERFIPNRKGKVGMYVCGPTTYDYSHVGHAKTYLFYDVLKRYLRHLGHEVTHVQNFTDIDENIIRRALVADVEPLELSSRFIGEFQRDMDALGIERADHHPRTTEHIGGCIDLIAELVDKGMAYEADGDVYFDVSTSKGFGRLIHEGLREVVVDDLDAVECINPGRRSLQDFAVWKRARPWEMSWDSPWGRGRPGWHTECAVMTHRYLGPVVDIHGGGMDLVFPHHESEALLADAVHGPGSTRYWVHNQFITLNGEKMSKSKGNLITVREALERAGRDALRFYLLSVHHRKKMMFSVHGLLVASRKLEAIRRTLRRTMERDTGRCREVDIAVVDNCISEFFRAMDSDMDTPRALSVIVDLCQVLDRCYVRGRARSRITKVLKDFQAILGIDLGV